VLYLLRRGSDSADVSRNITQHHVDDHLSRGFSITKFISHTFVADNHGHIAELNKE